MELKWLKVKSFRRFRKISTLNLEGRLVALVGPNESGKSSILKAINYLNNDSAIPDFETTRSANPTDTEISAGFFLEEEDLNVAKLKTPTWLKINKAKNGPRQYELDPKPPSRQTTHRNKTVSLIRRVTKSKKILKDIENNPSPLLKHLNQLVGQIENGPEDLNPNVITLMNQCSTTLKEHLSEKVPKYVVDLPDKLTELAEVELKPNPNKFATDMLKKRIPQFLEFADEHRILAPVYNLEEVAPNPPAPLKNLADIANLDLQKLLEAAKKGDWSEKKNLLDPANDCLIKVFEETWSQSGIHVHFEVEATILKILIVDERKAYSDLGERSDGLRQFVALQAFTTVKRTNTPILLIDEAETHLHYDGQADLVQMLTRQDVTKKVIYTTHSAGCLPEDLGVGTRLLVRIKETRTSIIQNKFWNSKEQGFSPLLFGMGATTLAFFPTRYAVVTEGVTEMLLLPTLFRQATDRKFLGFQVVPGLSQKSLSSLPAMETVGERVAYFVDADDGGEKLCRDLVDLGINPNRILSVRRPPGGSYTIEDFIDAQYFINAVNKLLDEFYPGAPHIAESDVTSPGRSKKLDAYFTANGIDPISKPDIAYQLLDFVADDSSIVLIDSKFKPKLKSIYGKIVDELDIKS